MTTKTPRTKTARATTIATAINKQQTTSKKQQSTKYKALCTASWCLLMEVTRTIIAVMTIIVTIIAVTTRIITIITIMIMITMTTIITIIALITVITIITAIDNQIHTTVVSLLLLLLTEQ